MTAHPPLLVLCGIGKVYGKVRVLGGVDLEIGRGEVVALLGENGAGKSTLSLIIAGAVPASDGVMALDGAAYAPTSPADAMAAGIGIIHQELKLLPELTIAENVFAGLIPMRRGIVDRRAMNDAAARRFDRLGLQEPPTRLVRDLRVAARQQVEIARALSLNARLLILDEPTSALGRHETDSLFEQLRWLRAEGMSFVYITHRMEEISQIADRIVVLRDGRIAVHRSGQVAPRQLLEEMVGRDVDRIFPSVPPPGPDAAEVLKVEGLTARDNSFRYVSLVVRAGEILGIAGIVGAGRTELVRAIAGADPVSEGRVTLDGRILRQAGPRAAMAVGVALVPEDRRDQGLVLEHSITDNLALTNMRRVAPGGWVWPASIARFGVKGSAEQPVGHLSGGNQQKVVIAKWASRNPRLFILDEPIRGIDVGARAAIYEVIGDLARRGVAVVVVSSDLDEVLGLSHRVLVMARGQVQAVLEGAEATPVAVMALAAA